MKLSAAGSDSQYTGLLTDLGRVLEAARHNSARAVNSVMTATYWELGRRIVCFEQDGAKRAAYGEELLAKLAKDLSARFGRGFGAVNLSQMKRFYLEWPAEPILQTPSEKSAKAKSQTVSEISPRPDGGFPLPWSHYVRLLAVKNKRARGFYEAEALRGGWSVRQLDRQISSLFYERTAMSRKKATMLLKGGKAQATDRLSAEEEVKDPLVLEFLDLKDEYSENELEAALLQHLESFLMELGGEFAFIGRQRRLRIGDEWYRVDLLFFHRRLRCLVVIDLKVGKFTHADAGQMHMYLNYAKEHWTHAGENPPVGLILCSQQNDALAKYALEGLPNRVLAREYRLALPSEEKLVTEIEGIRERLEKRQT